VPLTLTVLPTATEAGLEEQPGSGASADSAIKGVANNATPSSDTTIKVTRRSRFIAHLPYVTHFSHPRRAVARNAADARFSARHSRADRRIWVRY
jgi:hypothetical protein